MPLEQFMGMLKWK